MTYQPEFNFYKIEEKLPNLKQSVLVFSEEKEEFYVAWLDTPTEHPFYGLPNDLSPRWYSDDPRGGGFYPLEAKVSHWQPLPLYKNKEIL